MPGIFKVNWDSTPAFINQMYLNGRIIEKQKHGIVLCIPKTDIHTTLADCGPITVLNAEYKILTRIVANRLRPTFYEILHPSQYCAVPGNTIFDTVATVRDATAYAELAHP